ncbi:MAG TPA: PEP-CTERM sorting domain-containing protein [Phycisphaerae bacterium]|nr:PEP-CTERM sorting domain-containing protein [Phycisphaerae bacterium]
MKKIFATLSVLAMSAAALAGGVTSLQLMDNGGLQLTNPARIVDSVDLRLAMDANDDWTSTALHITLFGEDKTLAPPNVINLAFPAVVPADNDEDGEVDPIPATIQWRNARSSPSDYPNVIEIGSPSSTLGIAAAATGDNKGFTGLVYFDTTPNDGANFTLFRIGIASTILDKPDLTLENTGIPVARVFGTHTFRNSQGTLIPFDITVYQLPEPTTLALLALGGLAGVIRRR